jgi:outer membrane receptor protein involved in Fe transport
LPRSFYLAGDVAYTDRFFGNANVLNDPAFVVPSRAVTSATLGYEHRHLQLALSLRNAFDRDYLVGRDINNGAYVGDPRVVTFTAQLRF